MQQKVHLLNVNSISQIMGEEIYINTLFNRLWHYQCADVLVPRKDYSYQTDREPPPPLVHQHSKEGRKTNKESL